MAAGRCDQSSGGDGVARSSTAADGRQVLVDRNDEMAVSTAVAAMVEGAEDGVHLCRQYGVGKIPSATSSYRADAINPAATMAK